MVHSDLSNAKLLQKGDFGSWIRTDKLKKFWILDYLFFGQNGTNFSIQGHFWSNSCHIDLNHGPWVMVTKLMLVTIWCVRFSPQTEMVNISHFYQELFGQEAKMIVKKECDCDKFEMLMSNYWWLTNFESPKSEFW